LPPPKKPKRKTTAKPKENLKEFKKSALGQTRSPAENAPKNATGSASKNKPNQPPTLNHPPTHIQPHRKE
jgi:hypothetical protein